MPLSTTLREPPVRLDLDHRPDTQAGYLRLPKRTVRTPSCQETSTVLSPCAQPPPAPAMPDDAFTSRNPCTQICLVVAGLCATAASPTDGYVGYAPPSASGGICPHCDRQPVRSGVPSPYPPQCHFNHLLSGILQSPSISSFNPSPFRAVNLTVGNVCHMNFLFSPAPSTCAR